MVGAVSEKYIPELSRPQRYEYSSWLTLLRTEQRRSVSGNCGSGKEKWLAKR